MDVGDDGEEPMVPEPPEPEPGPSIQNEGQEELPLPVSHGPGAIAAAYRAVAADVHRARSPTPPRALYRSTTGKGVAFTDEDVVFLVRFLEYRSRQHDGKLDMVAFWKDVAMKVRISGTNRCSSLLIDFQLTGASPFTSILDEILQATQTRVAPHTRR